MTISGGAEPSVEASGNADVALGTRFAVVADDDDDSRDLLTAALRREGYEVVEARDGDDLIVCVAALFRDGHRNVIVVSDVGMPRCDGLCAARCVRTNWIDVPIVLVTGFTDERTWSTAHAVGANVILQKPLSANMLRDELKKLQMSA